MATLRWGGDGKYSRAYHITPQLQNPCRLPDLTQTLQASYCRAPQSLTNPASFSVGKPYPPTLQCALIPPVVSLSYPHLSSKPLSSNPTCLSRFSSWTTCLHGAFNLHYRLLPKSYKPLPTPLRKLLAPAKVIKKQELEGFFFISFIIAFFKLFLQQCTLEKRLCIATLTNTHS